MAYDEFENTSYDLNRDGHIDSAEASYIHETLYGDDKHGDHDDDSDGDVFGDDIFGDGGGGEFEGYEWHATPEERREMREKDEEFKKRLADSKRRKMLITVAVIIGVTIFVDGNAGGVFILFILYVIGTVIGFWN